ncbi:MAG: sigma-70 family RNA polymerase sigma factor [Balneola sp.]
MFVYFLIALANVGSNNINSVISRIQERDTKALEELYDEYSALLNGILLSIINKPTEAEDLLQEVFMIIWEKSYQFDPKKGHLRSWIITITKNKAFERLRSKGFKTQRKQSTSIDENEIILDGNEESPIDYAIHNDEAELMKQALKQIPENHRRMLHIAYYQDFTHSEIAKEYDIPLGTVKSRIRRGMQKLKIIIEKEFDYEH